MAIFSPSSCGIRHASVSLLQRTVLHLTSRYGTFVFNGLLKPLIFKPPAGIQLPHEPDLEETGEVPAASGQARAGYDVLPEHERPGQ